MHLPPRASDRGRGLLLARLVKPLVLTGVAIVALAPGAWASDEIVDPCGPGNALIDSSYEVEPQTPWLDICTVDFSGFEGDGSIRGVESVVNLHGWGASGSRTGVSYSASFKTELCTVRQEYVVYPGSGTESDTWLSVSCDYRREPCPWPQSEVPNYHCGTVDQIRVKNSAALLGEVSGNSATIRLDPNLLERIPVGLARDLASVEEEGDPVPTLTEVWSQTMLHVGSPGIDSSRIGPGGDFAREIRTVPLQ